MSQIVTEFAADDFVPGIASKARAAVQSSPSANAPMRLLLTGFKTSDGSMDVNTVVGPITTEEDAAAYAGVSSELARAFRAGRNRSKDLEIWLGCVEEPSGEKATAKATIGGTWSEGGSLIFWVDGDPLIVTVGSEDSTTDVAQAVSDELDKHPGYSYTVSLDGAEITFEKVQNGTRGNNSILYCDRTAAPSGLTVTLGGDEGGTVVSDPGPWALAAGDTLVVAFNAGGDQTFTIAATAAIKTGSGATYSAVTAGHSITIDINSTQYQAVFAGTENSQALFHAVLASVLAGVALVTNAGGETRITTSKKGSDITGSIVSGDSDVLTSLGLTASSFSNAGPNNVADSSAVTVAEWVTIMAAITNGTAEDDGGALRLTSATTGASGSAQVKSASTADDEMGFSNTADTGGVGGGASVTGDEVTGAGIRFAGGTGTEDVSDLLAYLEADPVWYKRIVVSSLDTVNLGLWEQFADEQNAPLVERPVGLILGHLGTQSAAIAISKTQCNHEAFEVLHAYDAETPACEIAATHAVERVLTERNGPTPVTPGSTEPLPPCGWNQSYSGTILPNVRLARDKDKIAASHSSQKSALQNGLTPLTKTAAGEAMVVRAIWTRCQNADGSANYLGLDVAEWTTLQEVREMKKNAWKFYRGKNPHVRDDFGKEPTVPGVATPSGFRQYLFSVIGQNLVAARVFESLPTIRTAYNRTTKRLQTETEYTRMPLHEQSEAVVTSLG